MTPLAALLIGHLLGDFVAQTDAQAARKADEWGPLVGHLATYHAVLAVALIPVWEATPALVTLAVSLVTHAVIDRRRFVYRLLQVTGSRRAALDHLGMLSAKQALHLSVLAGCTALWGVA